MNTVKLLGRLLAHWWRSGSLARAIWLLDYELSQESSNG